jgi:hypothetical protein
VHGSSRRPEGEERSRRLRNARFLGGIETVVLLDIEEPWEISPRAHILFLRGTLQALVEMTEAIDYEPSTMNS